jgi:Bacterial Ig domain
MKKLFLTILCFFLMCSASYASIDCDKTTLEAAVASAADGATITCNTGSIAYTAAATIDLSSNPKALTIIGTGLTITGDTAKFSIAGANGKAFRITGFTFTGNPTTNTIAIYGTSKNFRLDHLAFNVASNSRGIEIIGYTYGLIDHCAFNLALDDVYIGVSIRETIGSDGGSASWQRASSMGTASAVYIEDSTFTKTVAGDTVAYMFDVDGAGGRVVARYNTLTDFVGWTVHDAVSNGMRGMRHGEVYNNAIIYTQHAGGGKGAPDWRGGTGMIYNNTVTGTQHMAFSTRFMSLSNKRSYDGGQVGGVWETACDGNSGTAGLCPNQAVACTVGASCAASGGGTCIALDGNTDPVATYRGWPCRDQIGRGIDSGSAQASEPMYSWNNLVGGVHRAPDIGGAEGYTASHLVSERDYFDADTYAHLSQQPTGYTAYQYPHPLIAGGDTTPPTVTAFVIPSTAISLTVDVTTFTISDETALADSPYCISETSSSAGCSWLASAPATYTFVSTPGGLKTLYAFAKDLAGNISSSASDSITITGPTVSLTAPTAWNCGGQCKETITLSANCTLGGTQCAGVTFKYGATVIGAETTSSPFSVDWATTMGNPPNGNYSLTATGRAVGGATTVSTPLSITLVNPVGAGTHYILHKTIKNKTISPGGI